VVTEEQIQKACEITGAVICQFGPEPNSECDECSANNIQLWYRRTCCDSDEGEYWCAKCLVKMPEEWAALDKYYQDQAIRMGWV
jgi:hypothetical protein